MRSWSITSWPRKLWHSTQIQPAFTHFDTQISPAAEGILGGVSGQTSWVAELDGEQVALAWDWVMLRPGVLAIGDPMTIVSNLGFLGDDGVEIPPECAPARLNTIVHHLPWQAQVRRSLREWVRPQARHSDHLRLLPAALLSAHDQRLAA